MSISKLNISYCVYFPRKDNIRLAYNVGATADIFLESLYNPLNHVSNTFRNEYLFDKKIKEDTK